MMRRGTATHFEIRDSKSEIVDRDGFSLLEAVLVIAIIAVCAGIAIPRYARATSRYQADLAARRVAADLRQAQWVARTTSTSCTLVFTVATSKYQMAGVPAFDGSASTYTVDLTLPPYKATLVSTSFSGGQVVFSGWGLPNAGGTVVLSVRSEQRTITLDGQTGLVSIQ